MEAGRHALMYATIAHRRPGELREARLPTLRTIIPAPSCDPRIRHEPGRHLLELVVGAKRPALSGAGQV